MSGNTRLFDSRFTFDLLLGIHIYKNHIHVAAQAHCVELEVGLAATCPLRAAA